MTEQQLAIKCGIHGISQHCKDASFSIKDGNDYKLMTADEALIILGDLLYELPERKTGQWIPDQLCKHKPSRIRNTDRWTIYHCSCCGHSNGRRFNDRFCPKCGAKMILKTQGGDD